MPDEWKFEVTLYKKFTIPAYEKKRFKKQEYWKSEDGKLYRIEKVIAMRCKFYDKSLERWT